jgi:hypothetical protein
VTPARGLAAAGLLLALAACRSTPLDSARHIYAPHEEGLTLAYENPQLSGIARTDARLQVRVDSAKPVAGGTTFAGTLRHTRLSGETRYGYEIKDGGMTLADAEGRASMLLPEGFPDRVQAWGAGASRTRVLGRGTLPVFDGVLPKGHPKVGVWIESEPGEEGAPRTRTLLLPNVGPAEVVEFRGGKWVTVSRLVAYGFTDVLPAPIPVPAVIRGAKQ